MPIPKPDHRQSVELKFSKKEREFVDDWNLRQTVKAGGSVLSDLGSGLSSIISPFVSGGDAGLVMALAAAYIADDRLDLKTTDQLNQFLGTTLLYGGPKFGVYPSVFSAGGPVCFCDPEDFPEIPKHWISTPSQHPWEIWPDEAFEDTFLDKIIDWMRTEEQEEYSGQGPVDIRDVRREFQTWTSALKLRWMAEFGRIIDPNRSGPWRSLDEIVQHCFDNDMNSIPWLTLKATKPALTYDDPIPHLDEAVWTPALFEKYRFDQIDGLNASNEHFIVRVWNNQIEMYALAWQQFTTSARYILFKGCGGKPRSEIDSLADLLSKMSVSIPGAEMMNDVVDFVSDPFGGGDASPSQMLYVLERAGFGKTSIVEKLRAAGVQTPDEILQYEQSMEYPMFVKWPVWSQPPKSIYKLEAIHSTVECIKVLIPWYLGTKFAIEGAKAAGGIIPG